MLCAFALCPFSHSVFKEVPESYIKKEEIEIPTDNAIKGCYHNEKAQSQRS